jgi:hypothetical protein
MLLLLGTRLASCAGSFVPLISLFAVIRSFERLKGGVERRGQTRASGGSRRWEGGGRLGSRADAHGSTLGWEITGGRSSGECY